MALKIKHNGVEITKGKPPSKCFLYDRYGEMLDSLSISFPKEYQDLDFFQYDELEVIADGFSTGVMYVDGANLVGGEYYAEAISYKHINRNKSSGLWKNISLLEFAKDIAKNSGLTLKTYGVTDYVYNAISKVNETDLECLNRICKREGYSIKCDNGCLLIFNEHYLESNAKPLELKKSEVNPNYMFSRNSSGLSKVTVQYYDFENDKKIEYTAIDNDIQGGSRVITEYVKDAGEAERFAKGYLRQANKAYLTATISMQLRTDISAGTVLSLKEFEEYSGNYVAYEAVHDVLNERTMLKIRGILGY